MAATGQVTRDNRFLLTMRKLGLTASDPQIGQWSLVITSLRNGSDALSAHGLKTGPTSVSASVASIVTIS